MHADGFLNQRQHHPVAMGAAIAINASVLAAVMLAKGGYIPKPPTIIEVYPVPLSSPPPPHPIDRPKPPKAHATPLPAPNPVPVPPPPIDTGKNHTDSNQGWPPPAGQGATPATDPTSTPSPVATPEPPLTGPVQIGGDAQPPYPAALQRLGIEGSVVIRVLIGADGRVKQAEIVSSDDPAFAEATERQALRKWRFRPATRGGVAVESWKKLTVRFQMRR